MMALLILFQVALILPISLLIVFIPYWTRRTESFGVTVTEEVYNHPQMKQVRKQYSTHMSVFSMVFLLVLVGMQSFFRLEEDTAILSTVILILVLLAVGFVYYVIFHQQMKHFKREYVSTESRKQIVTVQTSFDQEKKTVSNYWFIIPFVIILITTLFTLNNYNLFPNKIPTNFNFTGEATNWVDKTKVTVLFIPVIQLYMFVIFMFVNLVIRIAKQQVDSNNPKKSLEKNILFRRRWSQFLIIVGTLTISLFSFLQYTLIYDVSSTLQISLFMVFIAFVFVGSVLLSFKLGQGGSRIEMHTTSNHDEEEALSDDDQHWKLGIFYVNKNDPALFIEKRFGIGWSVNFARPLVWIILSVFIGFALILPFLFNT